MDVSEDTPVGTTIFRNILVKDRDIVGESLDIKCIAQTQSPDACDKYVSDETFFFSIVF